MKEGYKITEVGNLPVDWNVKPIGQIATVVRGASPRPKGDPRYYGGTIPRLMGTDVTRDGKYVTPIKDFLTKEGADRSRFITAGTLVMICSGDVGVPTILAVDACVHDGFLAFPEISKDCEMEFLYYVFDSLYAKFNSSATHGGIFTNLTTSIIKEFLIPIPPLKQQKKITAILSTVDEKIEVIKKMIKETEYFKMGLMKSLLTRGIGHSKFKNSLLGTIPENWEVAKLKDLGNFKNGINKSKEDFGHGYPFINLKDVFGVNIVKPVALSLVNASKKELMDYGLLAGDVLFIRSSVKPSGVGLTAVVIDNIAETVYSGFLIRYRDNGKLSTNFKKHCFFEFGFRNRLLNLSSVSANTNINQGALENLLICIPPYDEQEKISSILSAIDDKLELLKNKKDANIKLKKGLMQQLLTGKIRIN